MPSLSMVDENGRCNIINFLQIVIYHENEKCNTPICYKPSFFVGRMNTIPITLHIPFSFSMLSLHKTRESFILVHKWCFLLGWTWKKKLHVKFWVRVIGLKRLWKQPQFAKWRTFSYLFASCSYIWKRPKHVC
jgi:hypothetical protein